MDFYREHLLSIITYTPLVGALVLLLPVFTGKEKEGTVRWAANAISLLGFLVSLPLWFWFDRSADGEIFNLGNPHELSVLDLAKWVIDLTGSSSTVTFVDRPVDDPSVRRPDTTLARERLNWSPQVSIEDGLLRTIAWFRGHPELV